MEDALACVDYLAKRPDFASPPQSKVGAKAVKTPANVIWGRRVRASQKKGRVAQSTAPKTTRGAKAKDGVAATNRTTKQIKRARNLLDLVAALICHRGLTVLMIGQTATMRACLTFMPSTA